MEESVLFEAVMKVVEQRSVLFIVTEVEVTEGLFWKAFELELLVHEVIVYSLVLSVKTKE